MRRAVAVVVMLAGAAAPVHGDAGAAGRRPYGGDVVLPVRDFGGLADPHAVRTMSGEIGAVLGHCRLFSVDDESGALPELAADEGRWTGRTLALDIVDGATFHDGGPITARDVVRSLARLSELASTGGLSSAWKAVSAVASGDHTVRIDAPPGAVPAEIRALLARPEAAIVRAGRPGADRGCGAFRVTGGDAATRELRAFDGHPRGRPWLARLTLRRVDDDAAEIRALVFGDVEAATVPSPRYRGVRALPLGGIATIVALPAPHHRSTGSLDLRRALARLARSAPLRRHVDGPATEASGPWPAALAPLDRAIPSPARPPVVDELVFAYPADDPTLQEVARALRDRARPALAVEARAIAVKGLDMRSARAETATGWDFAVLTYTWSARSRAQAALELAGVVDGPGPTLTAARALAREHRRWSERAVDDAVWIPLLHLDRPLYLRRADLTVLGGGGVPDLGRSWLTPTSVKP